MNRIPFLLLFAVLIVSMISLSGCFGIAATGEIEVDSTNYEGTKFVAPSDGSYEIAIIGGSYCYLPQYDPDWEVYGGWRTMLHMYINKPVEWSKSGKWGPNPINSDGTIGPDKYAPDPSTAETNGKDSSKTIQLNKGEYIIFLVHDGRYYYYDNKGTVKVRITRLEDQQE